jgi:hypothetical protein
MEKIMGRPKKIETEQPVPEKVLPVIKGARRTAKPVPAEPYEIIISISKDDYEISESGTPPEDFDAETFFDDVEDLLAAE